MGICPWLAVELGQRDLSCRKTINSRLRRLNVNETWFHLRLIYSYMIWAKWSDKKEEGEQWVGCKSKFIAGILLFSYHLKWMLWMIKKKKSMLTAAWNSNVYVPAFSRQIVRQWVIPFGSLWNATLIGLSLHGHVLVILISDVQNLYRDQEKSLLETFEHL